METSVCTSAPTCTSRHSNTQISKQLPHIEYHVNNRRRRAKVQADDTHSRQAVVFDLYQVLPSYDSSTAKACTYFLQQARSAADQLTLEKHRINKKPNHFGRGCDQLEIGFRDAFDRCKLKSNKT